MTAGRIDTAMVLAAGMGSRLRPLTDTTPKPLIEVAGQPVLLRTLMLLKGAGIRRVVINTHHLAEMLEQRVLAANTGLEIEFSREPELLETGGGLRKALPLLGDQRPFLVVNSDAVWREDVAPLLTPLMQSFNPVTQDVLMALVPMQRTMEFRDHGDYLMGTDGQLHRAAAGTLADLVYIGLHVTHGGFIARQPAGKFSLTRPWAEAEAAGRLHGWRYDGDWVDMGTPAGLLKARALAGEPTAL